MARDARIETAGQALTRVFGDPAWIKKTLIGAVVTMIPYVGAIWLMGYELHYQRAVVLGQGERLPEWKNFEPQAKTGLFAFIAGLVYSLPLSLLFSAVAVVAIAGGIVTIAATENVLWLVVWGLVLFALLLVVGVVYGVVLWPVYVHVQLHDTIESGFKLKEIYGAAQANSATFWTVARRSIALGLLSTVFSMLVMGVGLGGAAVLVSGVISEDALVLFSLLITPLQLVAGFVIGIVTLPIAFATARLWGEYAGVAYGLGPWASRLPEDAAPEA